MDQGIEQRREREAFRGESMWAHYRQYPGSYLNKREIFPSTTITQYLFTNRGYIEKIGKKSDQSSHQREKIFNEKKNWSKALSYYTEETLFSKRFFFIRSSLITTKVQKPFLQRKKKIICLKQFYKQRYQISPSKKYSILATFSKQICWIFTNQIIIHFKTSKYDTTVFEVIYGTCLLMV